MRVTISTLHLDDVAPPFEHGDVEGAAAEVEDHYFFILLLIKSVGERGGRRLVDDTQYFKPGYLPRGLGRASLVVIEIGGDGDDRLGDLLAKLRLRIGLHLPEFHIGNLFRAVPPTRLIH